MKFLLTILLVLGLFTTSISGNSDNDLKMIDWWESGMHYRTIKITYTGYTGGSSSGSFPTVSINTVNITLDYMKMMEIKSKLGWK